MSRDPDDVITPRILIVDDERQVHSSLRLRLHKEYDVASEYDGGSALTRIRTEQFDLCFVDVRMPVMDGLDFIAEARKYDPTLGFVILTAFTSDEYLRRAIPLGVLEFLSKPIPELNDFESRIPDWVGRTRRLRRDQKLAMQADSLASDLASARLAHEVELVASETARDALLQTSQLLTSIQAHLVTALAGLADRSRSEPGMAHLFRNLEAARRTADAAVMVAESFFDSAYGSRDHSPALVCPGISHAIDVARRMAKVEDLDKLVDFRERDEGLVVRGLSGIQFLLMMAPSIAIAIACASLRTTVRINTLQLSRLDNVVREPDVRTTLWVNRRNALTSRPGVAITIRASGPALSRTDAEAWLRSEYAPLSGITPRGLILGLQTCRGFGGIALSPHLEEFRLTLALPT